MTLAERQRDMRMRTQGLPRPKLSRTDALNALAAEIEAMPPGAEKAEALARYVNLKGRRRVTKIKHVSESKPEPDNVDEETCAPVRGDELFELETMLATMPDGTQMKVDSIARLSIDLCGQWQDANEAALGALVNFVTPSDFVVDLLPNVSARLLAAPSPESLLRRQHNLQDIGNVTWMQRWRDESE